MIGILSVETCFFLNPWLVCLIFTNRSDLGIPDPTAAHPHHSTPATNRKTYTFPRKAALCSIATCHYHCGGELEAVFY